MSSADVNFQFHHLLLSAAFDVQQQQQLMVILIVKSRSSAIFGREIFGKCAVSSLLHWGSGRSERSLCQPATEREIGNNRQINKMNWFKIWKVISFQINFPLPRRRCLCCWWWYGGAFIKRCFGWSDWLVVKPSGEEEDAALMCFGAVSGNVNCEQSWKKKYCTG